MDERFGDWLTVASVEEIHHAIRKGRSVGKFVETLRHATLPGLLEYGCLRWQVGAELVPALPAPIQTSSLGRALSSVSSPLGFGANGAHPTPPLNRVDTQEMEFTMVNGENELDEQAWKLFAIRFSRSAQSIGFTKTVGDGLMGSLYEMTRNALEHAESPVAALVGYQAHCNAALFSVVDVGIGVLDSLRSHPSYQSLSAHTEAIRMALKDGVSRHGQNQGGLGFRQVFKSLASYWGQLRFRSGEGRVTMFGNDFGPDQGEIGYPPVMPGFQVTVCCRTQAPSDDNTEPPLV